MSLHFDPNATTIKQLNEIQDDSTEKTPDEQTQQKRTWPSSVPTPNFEEGPAPQKKHKSELASLITTEPVSPEATASISAQMFHTPPNKILFQAPIPPTPQKNTKSDEEKKSKFPNLQPEIEDTSLSSQSQYKSLNLSLDRTYTHNNRTHTLLKQQSSKDCGATALLMLFTDFMRTESSISIDADLVKWALGVYLAQADKLINKAREYGMHMKKEKLPVNFALKIIDDNISTSSYPVIVSISEPYGGHWIMVDSVEEKNVYIRDPYFGSAHCIPKETFLSYLEESGIDQCLSVFKN